MKMGMEAMAVEMPKVEGHPNRVGFRGVLTLVGAPSDRPPSGARGHRVLLEAQAAEEALPTLIGMGLDYAPQWDGHDARRKIGVITSAELRPVAGAAAPAIPPGGARAVKRVAASGSGTSMHVDVMGQQRLEIAGHLFAHDFPEIVEQMRRGRVRLGMSYEIADVRVLDTKASVWVATEFTFTGAAVLRRDKAAYERTWVEVE